MDEHDQEVTKVDNAGPQPHKTATAADRPNHLDRRAQRLDDLRAAALEEPNPLRAAMRVATAQLLEISYQLGDEIKTLRGSPEGKLKSHQDRTGAVNTFMLVHRQIGRYVQLDQQWAKWPRGQGEDMDSPAPAGD